MHIDKVIEIISDNGGEMEHNDLKRAIFEAGGLPDHKTFTRILKSRKLNRSVSKLEGGGSTVIYRVGE